MPTNNRVHPLRIIKSEDPIDVIEVQGNIVAQNAIPPTNSGNQVPCNMVYVELIHFGLKNF